MINKSLYIGLVAISLVGLNSCDLDEYNPSAGASTLENFNVWAGLQTNCYSTLYHELYSKIDFLVFSEGGTDLWLNPSGVDYAPEVFYYDGLGVARQEPKKVWIQSYSVISTCNTVIEQAANVKDGDADAIRVLRAEAQTIRAFMHLTLVTYYGPIPLCTNQVGEVNDAPTRDSQADVYASIIADLKEAAENLDVLPYNNNYARVCKKTALGLLARAYAQGAGEGLTEGGVSYWQRAKEVAEDLITNAAQYGIYLYDDVDDVWAQTNNRGSVNKEYLFVAAGLDANGVDAAMAGEYLNATNYLYAYTRPNPGVLQDLYKTAQVTSNYYLGPHNESGEMAPSKHAIDVYGDWDKRYENSFLTAFGEFTVEGSSSDNIANKTITVTNDISEKYGWGSSSKTLIKEIDMEEWDEDPDKYEDLYPSSRYYVELEQTGPTTGVYKVYEIIDSPAVGKKIYPYVHLARTAGIAGTQTEAVGLWSKDGSSHSNVAPKNALVVPMPLEADDNRFAIYLSKTDLTAEQKAAYAPTAVINISELFGTGAKYATDYREASYSFKLATQAQKLFPMFIKYNNLYNGATREVSYEFRNGDIAIMRTAELYLIAAEAEVMTGNAANAIQYIEVLHKRAVRPGFTAPAVSNVTEQDILDEYAREMVGEHMRWPVLKRHRSSGLMKEALHNYNLQAEAGFNEAIHYYRPIPQMFLDQISNKDEFGDNGYGYTSSKGF